MMYWNGDWNWWTWIAMSLSMLVFWTAIGAAIWLVVRQLGGSATRSDPAPRVSAEEMLRQRYAAGELDEAEFVRRLETLREHTRTG